jgi:hypothetical protein
MVKLDIKWTDGDDDIIGRINGIKIFHIERFNPFVSSAPHQYHQKMIFTIYIHGRKVV